MLETPLNDVEVAVAAGSPEDIAASEVGYSIEKAIG